MWTQAIRIPSDCGFESTQLLREEPRRSSDRPTAPRRMIHQHVARINAGLHQRRLASIPLAHDAPLAIDVRPSRRRR